jgi:hypothetical protein
MKHLILSAALAASFSCSAAFGATVTVDEQVAGNPFGNGNLFQLVRVDYVGSTGPFNVNAGLFQLTGDGGFGDFASFCVELEQNLNLPADYEVPGNLAGTAADGSVADLKRLFASSLDMVETAADAAGFQLAIWEVVYDDLAGADLTTGDFNVVSASVDALAAATSFLAAAAATPVGTNYDMTFLTSDDRQDLIVAPVPLPAAGLMLLGGLGGFAAMRRKSKS